MGEHYVVLGLAPARSGWFAAVGRWASAAVVPVEFVRCVSPDELAVRLATGRPYSAAIVDAGVHGLDRDLIAQVGAADCTLVVVDAAADRGRWIELGADAVVADRFSRDELLALLEAHARPIGEAGVPQPSSIDREVAPRRGVVVAVTGSGGTGASVCAMALAQGLATPGHDRRWTIRRRPRDDRPKPAVMLADLCRYADQAMLHDSRVTVPGIQELVEAHRVANPSPEDVAAQTFEVADRGYRLVLGLRRPRHWLMLRTHAVAATVDALTSLVDVLVVDVEADTEGTDTGSDDVAERHVLARTTFDRADLVLVVGEPSTKGLHALVRTMGELADAGVPSDRQVPVLNRAPRRSRRRQTDVALRELVRARPGIDGAAVPAPVHLPDRDLEPALRDGRRLPGPSPQLLAETCRRVLRQRGFRVSDEAVVAPVPVRPGSLGMSPDAGDR